MDWLNLFANALWIAALALVLAVCGYARWRGEAGGTNFRAALAEAGPQFWLNLAGLLFSLGLAFSALPAWTTVIWLAPAVWFVYRIARLWAAASVSNRE